MQKTRVFGLGSASRSILATALNYLLANAAAPPAPGVPFTFVWQFNPQTCIATIEEPNQMAVVDVFGNVVADYDKELNVVSDPVGVGVNFATWVEGYQTIGVFCDTAGDYVVTFSDPDDDSIAGVLNVHIQP